MDSKIARERLSSVVRPDSITTSQGDFLATHVAIRKIHLLKRFDMAPTGCADCSEAAIFQDLILNPQNKHQFIMVYGHPGTGKSHLIRWFEARFEQELPDNEVVLFIKRSDNTLKGTIRQLLEKPEVQGIADRDLYKRLCKASAVVDENKLKDMIYHNFIIELHNDDGSLPITLPNVRRKRLEAFLNNEVIHDYLMSEDGPIERIYSKIAENATGDVDTVAQFKEEDLIVSSDLYDDMQREGADPKAIKMAHVLMSDTAPEESAHLTQYLNQFLNTVVQNCAGIEPGDFRQIFQDIRRDLFQNGKNLTLFIEDITSFTGVDEALLDALVVEHTGENEEKGLCRISSIVGTTNSYLQSHVRDNYKQRVTQYVYIPDNVFDENEIFEFIGRYLNTMSLPTDTISAWVKDHATAESYPVHTVVEGANWEFVTIACGKKLCLYPFTKNSIRYFYQNNLAAGHKTPRFIIRDIIEPVVNDALNNIENFPSAEFRVLNANTALTYKIHNQVSDQALSERLMRFLSIWGNGNPDKFSDGTVTYISAIPMSILQELHLPVLDLQQSAAPAPIPAAQEVINDQPSSTADSDQNIPIKAKERVDQANQVLSSWINGEPIDISATMGTSNILKAAQKDMCDYLSSSINWQEEGVSVDNFARVTSTTKTLVMFENQTKGRGFYVLPADWESMNIIMAFIRWREYGSQSWDYPDADFDAYLVSSWGAHVKDQIVQAVSPVAEDHETCYVDALIAAEIYRMVLTGDYVSSDLSHLTSKSLLSASREHPLASGHSLRWTSLLRRIERSESVEQKKKFIRRCFSIVQGMDTRTSGVTILRSQDLAQTLSKVKAQKLKVPATSFESNDAIKSRKDAFVDLRNIEERMNDVAQDELSLAKDKLTLIAPHLDLEDVDDDVILDLAENASTFYQEIEKTQINIKAPSMDRVKKSAKQIAQAINDISDILDETDPLKIIMAFSGDPIAALLPLTSLLGTLEHDLKNAVSQMETQQRKLGDVTILENSENRYNAQLSWIDHDLASLDKLR